MDERDLELRLLRFRDDLLKVCDGRYFSKPEGDRLMKWAGVSVKGLVGFLATSLVGLIVTLILQAISR